MNHRLKSILDEAEFGDYDVWFHEEKFDRLFALSVKECAAVVQDLVDRRVPASEYSQRLKDHFKSE